MSNFKIILTGIFTASIIVGIILFALSKTTSSGDSSLVIWGTISQETFNTAYKSSALVSNDHIKINYIKKDPATFDADFVEALAEGAGPDIVILRDDLVYKHTNKLLPIPYKNYSERSFKDNFIEEGELFLAPEGIISLPFIVDPMVMYWNRDLFSNNLIAKPPQYWDEFPALIDKITKRDSSANILQSTIAMGEWKNITNAKEIIATILLQAGTPITKRTGSQVVSVLNSQFNFSIIPSQSGISFYTQFSNPTSPTYTWNRSLPTSQNFFLAGNLATYLGFASEIASIQQKNSNLNFDVTYVPQIRGSTKKIIFAHMYGLSIVKQSKQIPGAYTAIVGLTDTGAIKALESVTNLPPVRRDLLKDLPTSAYGIVFYNSALLSNAWIDPDPAKSANTFRDMIESITSGRNRVSEALNRSNEELTAELK